MDNTQNNPTVWNEPFFKYRSLNKCYSNAISFMSEKFWKMLKLASPVIFVSSVLLTVLLYVSCDAGLEVKFADSPAFAASAALISLVAVSLLIAFIYRCISVNIDGLNFLSVGMKFIYNKLFWKNFLKAIIVAAITVLISAAVIFAADFLISISKTDDNVAQMNANVDLFPLLVKSGALVIVCALTIPLYMSLNELIIGGKGWKDGIWGGYKMGWRKWGKIFALELLVSISLAVIMTFILSPAYVISLMQHSATLSRLQGDAVDIPAYFPYLTCAILFLASVFISVLTFLKFIPQAYLYASFKTDEKQKDN